ncbi:MAG: PD40 domain-containing protein [Acidobacteria bacterium]|nr:PD40 domain-containing protein [Acidobacteriota bacterium]
MNRTTIMFIAALLVAGWQTVGAQQTTAQMEKLLASAEHKATVDGDLRGAIEEYKKIVATAGANRLLAATALVRMAECYQKLGDVEARTIYERVVREYADQQNVAGEARTRLTRLQSPAASQTKQATRQVWTGEGVDNGGTPSPDGRYLSFTDWDTGDLAVRDLFTGTSRRLTNTGGWVASGDYAGPSVISPDGRQVAYNWFVENEHKREIRTTSIATGELVRPKVALRTEADDYLVPFGWAPDGKHLLVIRSLPDHTNQIATISIHDGSSRSIKSLDWRYPDRLSLSPDGQYVAYDAPAGDSGSPRDIFVLATDGSRETAVVQGPANDSSPLWSPDGSELLFLSDRTGTNSLWTIPIDNGRPKGVAASIKTDVGSIGLLGITRNGTLYYAVLGRARRNVYVVELDALHATKPPVLATEQFINANIGPAWSRDGQFLAYYSFRNPAVLVIRSVKTGEERTIPLPVRVATPFFAGPRWFPDNRAVLILSRDAQGPGFGFHRLALDTGTTELLVHLPRQVSSFDLSPEGRSIFYIFQHPQTGQLMRFDIDSHREIELKRNEWFISLAVSPDGMQLAYLKSLRASLGNAPPGTSPSVVELMPAAGGQSREVFRAEPWLGGGRYNALAWSPDQRFLLVVRDGGPEQGGLWKVPAAGGEAEKVGISISARIKSPAVHPDGKRMIFAAIDADDNEVWVLENFLPAPGARK